MPPDNALLPLNVSGHDGFVLIGHRGPLDEGFRGRAVSAGSAAVDSQRECDAVVEVGWGVRGGIWHDPRLRMAPY